LSPPVKSRELRMKGGANQDTDKVNRVIIHGEAGFCRLLAFRNVHKEYS
jgi:hypothetical protein